MVRSVGAVIVGYLVMGIFVMITMTLAWKLTGPSFAYQEGSTHVTGGWVALSLALGVPAAVFGGWVCRAIALRSKPVTVLAWTAPRFRPPTQELRQSSARSRRLLRRSSQPGTISPSRWSASPASSSADTCGNGIGRPVR